MFTRIVAGAALSAVIAVVASSGARAGDSGEASGLDLQIGGVVAITPKYEGSDEYRVVGFPIIIPAGLDESGTVQFKGVDDVRYRLFETSGFEFGPLAGYRFGRDEDDSDRLIGLEDVDGGLVIGAYAAYRLGVIAPFVSYHHEVTGGDDTGGLVRFGAEVKGRVSPSLLLTALAGATYADDDYMEAYFSVPGGGTARLAPFDAEAGIKDVYVGLSGDVALDSVWTLKFSGRYARLLDDAADSPIVESEDQFTGGLGLTYTFSWSR